MARKKLTEARLKEFIVSLEAIGGSAGNKRLRETLGWGQDLYWRAQGKLIEDGQIAPGRGYGGSVRLTKAELATDHGSDCGEGASISFGDGRKHAAERDYYTPLKKSIETKWINLFGFDEVHVEETHSRGSKNTGGTFTRPDITVAGIRRYVYLPKTLEIITIEVKRSDCISIMGVLEALAHREASNRAYVFYTVSRAKFDSSGESERILELARKHEIGVVLTERPDEVESWEIVLEAPRQEPDPARLDRFLGDLPSEALKKQLSKWKE